METGEKSTNQLLGCTKPLTLALMARGATSCATYRNAASSTEAACKSASALSRSAGSKVWRALVTSSSNLGLLIKPQLFDTGGAIDDCRKRTMAKNGAIAAYVTWGALGQLAGGVCDTLRLLQIFVHRQRQHLAGARRRGLDFHRQFLVRTEPCLLHQLLRGRLVELD